MASEKALFNFFADVGETIVFGGDRGGRAPAEKKILNFFADMGTYLLSVPGILPRAASVSKERALPVEQAETATVLLAETDPGLRAHLRTQLEIPNVEVVGEAESGSQALEMARELAPDVVLMDIVQPTLDGLRAVTALRQLSPSTHVILLTNRPSTQVVGAALRLGVKGIVAKGSASELLRNSIEAVMAGEYWVGGERTSDPEPFVKRTEATVEDVQRRRTELTVREKEIASFIAAGLSNKDMAQRLGLTDRALKHHISNMFKKLGVSNRIEFTLLVASAGEQQNYQSH